MLWVWAFFLFLQINGTLIPLHYGFRDVTWEILTVKINFKSALFL